MLRQPAALSWLVLVVLVPQSTGVHPYAGSPRGRHHANIDAVLLHNDDFRQRDPNVSKVINSTAHQVTNTTAYANATTQLVAAVPAAVLSPPISMAMKCMVILSVQYFAVHLLVLVVRALNQVCFARKGRLEAILETASASSHLLPMVGVVFLICYIRADQVTRTTQPLVYGLPDWWMNVAMLVATVCGIVGMCCNMFMAVCQPGMHEEQAVRITSGFLGAVSCLSTFLQYVAGCVLIWAAIWMREPFNVWMHGGSINLTPAVSSTVCLAIQYFIVYLVLLAALFADDGRTAYQLGPSPLMQAARAAAMVQHQGPTFCVLFTAAHLRAVHLSPAGRPQSWAEYAFSYCVCGFLAQTLLSVISAVKWDGRKRSDFPLDSVSGNSSLHALVTACRWVALICVYAGMTAVVMSVLLMQAPDGTDTPPLESTLTCVLLLTLQYFAVHLLLFIATTMEQARARREHHDLVHPGSGVHPVSNNVMETLAAAKDTVTFAPMMCVLFLAAGLRAAQFSAGALPQRWVQDSMYVGMWASLLQLVLVVATGIFTGSPARAVPSSNASVETDPQLEPKKAPPAFIWVTCQFINIVCIFVAVSIVIVGTFTMTAENIVATTS